MTPTRNIGAALASAALLLTSCVGTEVGNPATAETSIEFTYITPNDPGALTLASGITIESAWLALDAFELSEIGRCRSDAEDDDDDDDELVYPDAVYVELLSGTELSMPAEFLRDAGDYCQFRMALTPIEPEDTPTLPGAVPDALLGASLYITGTRVDGTPFSVQGSLEENFRFKAAGDSFALAAGPNRLFVGFDIEAWFAGVDLNEAELDASGVIRITESENRSIYGDFRNGFRNTARLFKDDNRNGVLEPVELSGPLALPETP